MAKIQLRRGPESRRSQVTPQPGEPLVSLDTKELHIGDGTTAGGFPVGTVRPTGAVEADRIAAFADDTGRVLKGITKASILSGYATEKYVEDKILATAPGTKVNKAVLADTATNAERLGGKAPSEFLDNSDITDNYNLVSTSKVVSASGTRALFTALNNLITGLTNSKLDKTAIANNLSTTDSSKVLAAPQGKALSDRIDAISGTASGGSSIAQQAKRTAESALREASDASKEASSALSVANSARSAASSASSKADSAKSTASVASNVASDAKSRADTASSRATSAYDLASTANSKANSAKSTADNAKSRADSAYRLAILAPSVHSGTGTPPSYGSDGDIFVQY